MSSLIRFSVYASFLIFIAMPSILNSYAYLPDEMSLSDALLVNAHNSPCSIAYGWRYAQQKGTLVDQWMAGARGMKINFHWRKPMSFTEHISTLMNEKATNINNSVTVDSQESLIKRWFKKAKKAVSGAVKTVSQKFMSQEEKKPFIGLCHEPDGANNCMLSAYLQKSGEVDSALSYFTQFAQLMKNNPDDVAIIIIEDYLNRRSEKNGTHNYSYEDVQKALNDVIEQSGLASYALKLESKYFSENPEKWPTVGELREKNKRLLLFTHSPHHAANSLYLNYYGPNTFRRSHWAYDWEADLGQRCRLLYDSNATMFMISHGAEVSLPVGTVPSGVLALLQKFGFKPTVDGGGQVKGTDYKNLNSEKNIRQRIADCQKESTSTPVSVIGLDFVEEGDVYNTVKKINNERAQALGLQLKS